MKSRIFGCRKFGRLSSEQSDRDLSAYEQWFLTKHRAVCAECRKDETTSTFALSMLREATLEPEIAPMFEDRVIRRLKVQQVRESLNYWSPALVAAGIACAVIFVTLHLASSTGRFQKASIPDGVSRRESAPRIAPRLILDHIPVIR